MKPFNLEEYLKNPEKKVVTRDGRKVRIICTDAKTHYPVIALAESTDGTTEQLLSFIKNGKYFDNRSNVEDLFFAPEKKEGWINLYRTETSNQYVTSNLYNSEEKAIEIGRTSENYIATTKIEWGE